MTEITQRKLGFDRFICCVFLGFKHQALKLWKTQVYKQSLRRAWILSGIWQQTTRTITPKRWLVRKKVLTPNLVVLVVAITLVCARSKWSEPCRGCKSTALQICCSSYRHGGSPNLWPQLTTMTGPTMVTIRNGAQQLQLSVLSVGALFCLEFASHP